MGVTKVLLQIEKKTNQMVQLLTALDETMTWYSIKKIAIDLNVTVSTARRYVEELQSSLPNGWEIAQQAYKGIMLIKPADQSIQAIIQSWITETLMFQMLELGFREQASNLQTIAQQSYTSIPSLYRMIRKANEFFEKDGITISKSPFKIQGKEEDIRTFFFHLFRETEAMTKVFPQDLLAIIHEHVAQLENITQFHFSFTEKKKITLFIAICIYRSKKKKHITTITPTQEDIDHSVAFMIFSFNRKLKDLLGMSLPVEEQRFLSQVFHQYTSRRVSGMLDYSMIETVEGFHFLADRLGQIAGTSLKNNNTFIDLMNRQLRFFSEKNQQKDYLYYDDEKLFLEVQTRFRSLYQQVSLSYQLFDRQSAMYQIESEKNVVEMVLFLVSIQNNLEVKKVLLFINKGPIWVHFLIDLLRAKFHRGMEIQIVDYIDDLYTYDMRAVDFVISDTEVGKLAKPVVVIAPLPSIRDFNTIEEMLVKTRTKEGYHIDTNQDAKRTIQNNYMKN
ncbi:helix-turn-helix domain-containing protein [Listeria booriae]|uniref:helix-turn-helix domain-containing protein n=1 Tax=Listeria booriae TaxID=1552123 RepID=UPI001628CD28|nr:helix-turn-helix domain-containing protein [Listeria booriae]MBC2206115.1 hypothetical protein [Listeria booriae]